MILKKMLQAVIVFFLLELVVMIWVGTLIGAWKTILLVLLSAVIGLLLIQKFGYKTFQKAQEQWSSGQPPGHTILKGVLQSLGAILFIFPGFISDIIGILLLIPFTRKMIQQMAYLWLKDRAMRRFR
ncbi:FxsA family protein [Shimazuella sp. AN120528]|uniref:FxsA family protein n=1 Tax=Shimazuella soli TaxID=1892854 RepID=UPI001F116093|nr:FxsA family protein [Shimazuella soli]MCH5584352.1 FxsA family protein [Shimazuella soli]